MFLYAVDVHYLLEVKVKNMIFTTLFISIISLVDISIGRDTDDLIVKLNLPESRIRGHALKSAKGNKYYAFEEIPYGAPPIGENRFKPSEFHAGWDGVLNTTQNRRACYQFSSQPFLIENTNQIIESEDCLFLDVFTPVVPGSKDRLPVYLYIHGCSFSGCSKNLFGPKYLIDGGIVIVTINYRLGALGFLSTEDDVVPGNMGLKDQHLALQWTHKNIELFGGNPKDIVIGGQSAGSFSTSYQLLSPKNKGLLSGIIQQSGCSLSDNGYESTPRKSAFALAEVLNIPITSDNTSSIIESMRQIPVEEFRAAALKIPSIRYQGYIPQPPWTPFVEQTDEQAIISSPMHQDFIDGNFNHVPSLIGFNSEESVVILPSDSELQQLAATTDIDPSLIISDALNVENRTLAGIEIKELYTSTSFTEDLGAFVKLTSDAVFSRSIIRQAKLTSQHAPAYLYQFSAGKNSYPKYPGIAHAAELSYLWDMSDGNDYSDDSEAVREMMLTLWWNFIKYKNPTPTNITTPQDIEWPSVEYENIRYLNINDTLTVQSDPRNFSSVEKVLLKHIRPPYYFF